MKNAFYFRQKAEQCRRLAAGITARNDPTASALRALAEEFDLTAKAIDARNAAVDMTSYGGDVPTTA